MNAPDGNRPASAPAERVVLGPAGEEERVLLATDHNIPAPTPAELAQLAVAMVTAGIASKHNPSEAMRIASDWWIAARRRSEQVELAEMYRRIALDIRVKRAEAGEMSEDAVMTMATHVPKSPTHFRGRAADFFALDWAQPNVHLSDISRRALQLFAAARDQMRIQALEPVPRSGIGRRWKHTIALAFVEYLIGTITTRDRYAVVDGDFMRMLNVNECRRAMGFPDGYALPPSGKLAKHMLGNAVCPPVARDILAELRRAA